MNATADTSSHDQPCRFRCACRAAGRADRACRACVDIRPGPLGTAQADAVDGMVAGRSDRAGAGRWRHLRTGALAGAPTERPQRVGAGQLEPGMIVAWRRSITTWGPAESAVQEGSAR